MRVGRGRRSEEKRWSKDEFTSRRELRFRSRASAIDPTPLPRRGGCWFVDGQVKGWKRKCGKTVPAVEGNGRCRGAGWAERLRRNGRGRLVEGLKRGGGARGGRHRDGRLSGWRGLRPAVETRGDEKASKTTTASPRLFATPRLASQCTGLAIVLIRPRASPQNTPTPLQPPCVPILRRPPTSRPPLVLVLVLGVLRERATFWTALHSPCPPTSALSRRHRRQKNGTGTPAGRKRRHGDRVTARTKNCGKDSMYGGRVVLCYTAPLKSIGTLSCFQENCGTRYRIAVGYDVLVIIFIILYKYNAQVQGCAEVR